MKRKVRVMVTLILILSMVIPSYASVGMNDISGHWAESAIKKWIGDELVSGYSGNIFKPNASISRAEFYTLIHNIISLNSTSEIPFTDVKASDWYADSVAFAYETGLTNGYPDGTFRPQNKITREEVAVVISKLLEFAQENDFNLLSKFGDYDDTDLWNRPALEVLVKKGLLSGYPDNSLRSNNYITRAEAVVLLDNVFGEKYLKSGVYGGSSSANLHTIKGNVTINTSDVTLKNMVIKGDVFITENVGEGELYFDNVTIEGDTIVKGGGENSLFFNNVNVKGTLLVKKANNNIRIVASGNTEVKVTVLESGAILLEQELEGVGFETIEIPADIAGDSTIVLDGDFESVSVDAANVEVELSGSSQVSKFISSESASNLKISGSGSITSAEINAINTSIEVKVDAIVVKDGIEVEVIDRVVSSPPSNQDSESPQMWTLTWSDEFNGSEIDRTKWKYDIGNWIVDESGAGVAAGWGNNEKEYYTDSSSNSYLENGKLVIKALEEETTDNFGTYQYTSAKLLTKGLFSQKYGKYEIRAKLPLGKGLWPAIWMLPADDVYGGWAASGEIDIVEGWGSRPNVVAGTIHYGALWPNNKYSGKEYTFANSTVNEFHTYSLEWEPGELRWYVDNQLYQTQNNWNTKDANGEEFSFPAPFDQEFYMILNLAVGGHFDGEPTNETPFPSTMEVDYVRVYELTGRDYMVPKAPNATLEDLPEGAKVADAEGNLISNGDFSEAIQDNYAAELEFSDKWNFVQIADFGGIATQSIESIGGSNYAKVDIANGGSQSYSVQLIQLTTLGKGRYYEVSFDAKASGSRTMIMKMSAGEERGWTTYSDSYTLDLTDTLTTYKKTFQMTADSDIAARLEMNLGLNTNTVWIGNVTVKEIPEPVTDYDASKSPLPDGNGVYNGAFDKESLDRMAYWNLTTNNVNAISSVSESTRMLYVNVGNGGTIASDIILDQKGIQLEENTEYTLTIDAKATAARTIQLALSNTEGVLYTNEQVIDITEDMNTYTFNFKMNDATDLNSILMIKLGGNSASVYLDNIVLKATSVDYSNIDVFPLDNGNFANGLNAWNNYVHFDAAADIYVENEAVKIAVGSVGAETWGIQFYQGAFDFSNKVEYIVAFDVKSDVDRNLEVVLDNSSYHRYLSETVAATNEYTRYEFTLKLPIEDTVSLKFLLGKTDGGVTLGAHNIYIDNVVCEVKDAPLDANLIIKNGTFETNVDKWTLYTADGSNGTIGVSSEEMKIDFSAYSGWFKWSTQVYQDIIKLENGKTYELSFDARSTIDRDFLLQMTDLQEQTVSMTSTMTNYKYTFTATADTSAGKLNFLLGTNNMDGADFVPHSVYLDNISIIESTPVVVPDSDPSIIKNGYFNTDTSNWVLYTNDGSNGSVGVTDESLEISFPNYAGWFIWSTQVYQEDIVFEAGKTYELTFDARSTANRSIWLELNNIQQQELLLTNTKKTFSYKFTASESITNGKLNFLLGTNNQDGGDFVPHSVFIDNVEINEQIISNGNFDASIINWSSYTGDGSNGTFTHLDGALDVYFANYAGWFKWSTQLYQEGLDLKAGVDYTLKFDARSTLARDAWLEVDGLNTATFALTDSTQTFSFDFTVNETTTNGKVLFMLGTENLDGSLFTPHHIIFDNIEIIKK